MRMPRYSIRWLMMAVAVSAVFFWILASVENTKSVVAGTLCLVPMVALGTLPWIALKGKRRLAAWVLSLASVLGFVPLAALGIFSLNFLAVVYRIMIGFVVLPFVLGAGLAWAPLATSPDADRRRRPIAAWSLVAALAALPVSMMFTDWPMWAAFEASRPALDRLADRLDSGGTLQKPEWAGLFLVRKSRPNLPPGTVALVVENDSSGHTWLVRGPAPEVTPEVPRPYYSVISTVHPITRGVRWWRYDYD